MQWLPTIRRFLTPRDLTKAQVSTRGATLSEERKRHTRLLREYDVWFQRAPSDIQALLFEGRGRRIAAERLRAINDALEDYGVSERQHQAE